MRFVRDDPESNPVMLIMVSGFRLPLSELELSYARSSGPGGQNVNKVNSKAVLRWNILQSPSLPEVLRTRLLSKLASKLTGDGELVIFSDRFRDQGKNRQDCLEKLQSCLADAATVPKLRKKTMPSKASQRRVKEGKRKQSEKKTLRRSPL